MNATPELYDFLVIALSLSLSLLYGGIEAKTQQVLMEQNSLLIGYGTHHTHAIGLGMPHNLFTVTQGQDRNT